MNNAKKHLLSKPSSIL